MSSPRHQLPERAGSVPVRWAALVALLLSTALVLAGQPGATATVSAERSRPATVAHTDQGTMTSRIVGKSSTGQRVTGTFTPLRAVTRHGQLMLKGVVEGVVHRGAATSTFTAVRSIPVRSADGQSLGRSLAGGAAADGAGRAACDILHLVLGPLDLDLLGLQVHLNRVVLDVVAVAGAGNLLGNLLCAITGLLDGTPAAGLLGQLRNLLNQILGLLRLGV
jgi:hypothetical protein